MSSAFHGLRHVRVFDEDARLAEVRKLLGHATGAQRRALLALELGFSAARGVPSVVTPASLAWMTLWTRAMSLALAVPSLLKGPSSLPLSMLYRSGLENLVHSTLLLGAHNGGRFTLQPSSTPTVDATCERLVAYLAWSLAHDLMAAEARVKAAKASISDQERSTSRSDYPPEIQRTLERLLGEEEVISPQEADLDRQKELDRANDYLLRIRRLYDDEQLAHWTQKLKTLRNPSRLNTVPELSQLLYGKSRGDALKAIGVSFPGIRWTSGSQLIHGSTLDHAVLLSEDGAMPRVVDLPDSLEAKGLELAEHCLYSLLALSALRPAIDTA